MKSCRIFEPPHVGCYINTRDVRQLMEFLGDSLDYSNFKNTVARTPDQQAKHDAYASVWHTMIDALGGYGRGAKKK